MHRTMPTTPFHPGPGQRNRPATISNRHQQQLMTKTYFATIHDQSDFSGSHPLNDRLRNGLVPFTHTNGWIVQQASYAPCKARQTSTPGNLLSHFAQMYTAAFVQSNQQPTEVPDPSNPLSGAKFSQHLVTSMVKFWYRHDSPRKLVCDDPSLLEDHAVFYSPAKTIR